MLEPLDIAIVALIALLTAVYLYTKSAKTVPAASKKHVVVNAKPSLAAKLDTLGDDNICVLFYGSQTGIAFLDRNCRGPGKTNTQGNIQPTKH
jgi:hypothetical protein